MTAAVKELIDSARAVLPFLSRFSPERERLALAIAEAVKAEEKPHPFRSFYVTPWRALMGPCAVAFCGQPADAPIHQKAGK